MHSIRLVLGLLAVALFVGGLSDAGAGESPVPVHENPRWGFKVRAPARWKRRLVQLEEPWIADKFFPNQPLRARGAGGQLREHVPSLWVIGFPHLRTASKGKQDEALTRIAQKTPYKDYLDFVKREEWASVGEGGWFVSRDETLEHAGHPVRVVEIKVVKLVVAPLRIVTWIYECEDVDFAVQVSILDALYDENRNQIERCLKSFREIPRTESLLGEEDETPSLETSDGERRSALEIYLDRVQKIEERIGREVDRLPKGWLALKSPNFVCLSQVDKQHTRYVLNFAEEIRRYLEKNFDVLGEDEVPHALIRVFATNADEQAYLQGTRGWWTDEVGEVTLTFGRDASILAEFSSLATRLTDQYFHIKSANLERGMPRWLRAGIWGHIAWARPSKRKKMVMAPTPSVRRALAMMFAEGSELPLGDLMTVPTTAFGAGQHAQAESVVHWLLGRGNRGKVKAALTRYLLALDHIIREEERRFEIEEAERWREEQERRVEQAEADRDKTEAEREADEDAYYRGRRERLKEIDARLEAKWAKVRERAIFEAFGHLQEKDWRRLDKAWKKSALR